MKKLRVSLFLFLSICAFGVQAQTPTHHTLPSLGDTADTQWTPLQELQIAQKALRFFRGQPTWVGDPEMEDYLNAMAQKIKPAGLRGVGLKPLNIQCFVLKDSSINAFAIPGGLLGFHSGLLLATQSESEIAAVMAHEMAHIAQRHSARSIQAQRGAWVPTVAGLLIAILAAQKADNLNLGAATVSAGQAYQVQKQIDITRRFEQEADALAVEYLMASGYNPQAIPDFFARLNEESRYQENNAPAFLLTHPVTLDRISESLNRLQNLPYKQYQDSLDYFLMQEKARNLQQAAPSLIPQYQQNIADKRYRNLRAQYFGLAIALQRAGKISEALSALSQARSPFTLHPVVENLQGELLRDAGQAQASATHFKEAITHYPDVRVLRYNWALSALAAQQYEGLTAQIDTWIKRTPEDAQLYELQAKAYAAVGDAVESHAALGQAYVLWGLKEAAAAQWQIALQQPQISDMRRQAIEAQKKALQAQVDFLE